MLAFRPHMIRKSPIIYLAYILPLVLAASVPAMKAILILKHSKQVLTQGLRPYYTLSKLHIFWISTCLICSLSCDSDMLSLYVRGSVMISLRERGLLRPPLQKIATYVIPVGTSEPLKCHLYVPPTSNTSLMKLGIFICLFPAVSPVTRMMSGHSGHAINIC